MVRIEKMLSAFILAAWLAVSIIVPSDGLLANSPRQVGQEAVSSEVAQPADFTAKWVTDVNAQNPDGSHILEAFDSALAACHRRMIAYGGQILHSNIPSEYWDWQYCDWSGGLVLPSGVYLECLDANGEADPDVRLTIPGRCVTSESERPECACSPTVGNPISLATASKFQVENDYSTADGLLAIERNYRSRMHGGIVRADETVPGFGQSWIGVIPGRVGIFTGTGDPQLEYLSSSGGRQVFDPVQPAEQSNFAFKNSSGTRTSVSIVASTASGRRQYLVHDQEVAERSPEIRMDFSNGDYILFQRKGSFRTYVSSIGIRYAMPIEQGFASGYRKYFHYAAGESTPHKISDSFGREIDLSWADSLEGTRRNFQEGIVSRDVVTRVVERADLPDGTTLNYTYDDGRVELRDISFAARSSSSSAPLADAVQSGGAFKNRLRRVERRDSAGELLWARSYEYDYDVAGLSYMLTGVVDQDGNRLSTYDYDSFGRPISTELAGGVNSHHVEILADGTTLRRRVTDALGSVATYDFQKRSDLDPRRSRLLSSISRQEDAFSPGEVQTINYTFDRVSGIVDRAGHGARIIRDSLGRPIRITHAENTPVSRDTIISWHPTLDLPLSTEEGSLRHDFVYDEQARLTSVTQTDIGVQSTPYATHGAARAVTYTWTNEGRVASINGPLEPAVGEADDLTSFTYDESGNLLSIINALGHTTAYEQHDANGRPGRVIDPNGTIAEMSYDGLGRIVSVVQKHPTNTAFDAVTNFSYDREGRITSAMMPDTDPISFTYDLAGRLTEVSSSAGERIEFDHDAMGNVLAQRIVRSDASVFAEITRTFDSFSRLLTETLGQNRTVHFSYDLDDYLTGFTDGRGLSFGSEFDALHRKIAQTSPNGARLTTEFNELGDPILATDAIGVATQFIRNGFGDVIQEVSPDRGTSIYYYDETGRMVSMTDGRGQQVDYTYDVLGRVTSSTTPGASGGWISYIYDLRANEIGRLSKVVDNNIITNFWYDHRGNIRHRRERHGSDYLSTSYVHDLADRVVQMTYPSGRIVNYERDTAGRVETVTTQASAAAPLVTLLTNTSNNPFGDAWRHNLGNGLSNIETFQDGFKTRFLRVQNLSTGAILDTRWYGYDSDNNIISINTAGDTSKNLSYSYDDDGRLITSVIGDGTGSDIQGQYSRQDFVYDANGNRTAVRWRVAENENTPAKEDLYQITAGTNRLATITTASGQRSFTHDSRGNLAAETRPDGTTISTTYDGYGRLTQFEKLGEVALVNRYSGLGDRIGETTITSVGMEERLFVYDMYGRVLGEYSSSAGMLVAERIWLRPDPANDAPSPFGGGDGMGGYGLLAIASPDPASGAGAQELTWVHSDHLGRPEFYSDADGQIVDPESWSQHSFPGQLKTLADLHYNRHRDYDPTTGRYIQADPIGLAGGDNPYLYANGNPVGYIDPLGLAPEDWIGAQQFAGIAMAGDSLAMANARNAGEQYCLDPWEIAEGVMIGAATGFGFGKGLGVLGKGFGRRLGRDTGVDASTLAPSHAISGRASSRRVNGIADSMRSQGYVGDAIQVIEHKGKTIIVDGHHRAAAAIRTRTPVDVEVVGPDRFPMGSGGWRSIDEVIQSSAGVGPNRLRQPGR